MPLRRNPRKAEGVARRVTRTRTTEGKVREARRVARQAQAEATAVHTDEGVNRSTRTRTSYRIKAEALDRVERVLAGKE